MENLDIHSVLNEELIVTDIEGEKKEDVIDELAQLLEAKGYLTDKKRFIQDVLIRETEGVTGLGSGIAIPHGKSEGVSRTTIAIGKTRHNIDWGSLDDQPVNVIILFAVKKTDETTTHIKLLQKVAMLLADDELLESLHKAASSKEIFSLITEY